MDSSSKLKKYLHLSSFSVNQILMRTYEYVFILVS